MPSSVKRREFLSGLMKLLSFIAFIFISIPFISSFSTKSIDEKKSSPSRWVVTLGISDFTKGKIETIPWAGGLFWVYARTDKDIELLKQNKNNLRDTASEKSDQPEHMKSNFRSASKAFFVFIPQENKRGCQISLNDEGETALFTEPCYNAKYDSAGRIFRNSGHKEQQNLAVPNHVIEDGMLKIGIWMPKI